MAVQTKIILFTYQQILHPYSIECLFAVIAAELLPYFYPGYLLQKAFIIQIISFISETTVIENKRLKDDNEEEKNKEKNETGTEKKKKKLLTKTIAIEGIA